MARTIRCEHCGVILNVPEHAPGKRLRCPRCGSRFLDGRAAPQVTTRIDKVSKGRDAAFDLPLLTESGPHQALATRETGSALALFEDERPARRRPVGAEARARARRCPTCGGFVPVGMSLCAACGLDLDSGRHVAPVVGDDELLPQPPPISRRGMTIGAGIVGGLAAAGSLALLVDAVGQGLGGMSGARFLAALGAFGVYAAIQFLRGRSIKTLMLALTLGAILDLVALIAMPVVAANVETAVVEVEPSVEEIQPITERIDAGRIGIGIGGLVLYAATSIYLLSPAARQHLTSRRTT
jgi:phage FluMu protein Com